MEKIVQTSWPVMPGSYVVGDPRGPVAVCTLTSEKLMNPLARLPGVAIAGMVYTANLGITRIVVNITTNPSIRFLLLCGKDSQLFRPGQSLAALADHGVDDQKRIVNAVGYDPVLPSLSSDQITQFRKQVEIIDWTGEEDLQALTERIATLSARNPGPLRLENQPTPTSPVQQFVSIRPGGQREPLIYDPKGYFVISIEPDKGEIVLRHYLPDHTPAHEMRGRGATSMLLGLLRDGLVTQLSHSGYLGEELAKAQAALQFKLRYDQDRPLRSPEISSLDKNTEPTGAPEPQTRPMARMSPPLNFTQFKESALGKTIDVVLTVNDMPGERTVNGLFLEMDEAEPFTAYHRTEHSVKAMWTTSARFIMGQESEIQPGAMLRIFGKLCEDQMIAAETIIILTKSARILA